MNSILRFIPGDAARRRQIDIWRAQMRELRPFYPIVLPFLVWVFVRSYRDEQDRMRRTRLAPILKPSARPPETRPDA